MKNRKAQLEMSQLTERGGYFSWVKKLGQWHLGGVEASETLCKAPMLGNNYANMLPIEDREPCAECLAAAKGDK